MGPRPGPRDLLPIWLELLYTAHDSLGSRIRCSCTEAIRRTCQISWTRVMLSFA